MQGQIISPGNGHCLISRGAGEFSEAAVPQIKGYEDSVREEAKHRLGKRWELANPIVGTVFPNFGMIRPGLKADLVVVEENPLENLKVLYGTGAVRLNDDTGEVERVGGIKYTIKDGIVYDAKQLLADVREMVRKAKAARMTMGGSNN